MSMFLYDISYQGLYGSRQKRQLDSPSVRAPANNLYGSHPYRIAASTVQTINS